MSRGNLAWMLLVPAGVLTLVCVTLAAPEPDPDYKLVRTLVDVLATVDKNYVRKLTPEEKQKLVEDMLNGGLARLDPHSQYLNEQQVDAFDAVNLGEFGGIGVVMGYDVEKKCLVVESAVPGSPAYEAGLQPGDLILTVAGKPTAEMTTTTDARKLITGKPGTDVTMGVKRGAGTLPPADVTLTRATIETHVVEGYRRSEKNPTQWDYFPDPGKPIALIRVTGFNGKTNKDLKAAVDAAMKAGAKALILDLRENPGGLLHEAVEVSDLFLAGGTVVSTRSRDVPTRQWTAKDDGTDVEKPGSLPMAVLIDRGSASASEIVAAALHDNGRAVLVGERTYGKGSVQKVFELSDRKTGVKLTFEEWLTPSGQNLKRPPGAKYTEGFGVVPDAGCEVPWSEADMRAYALFRQWVDVVPGKPSVAPPRPATKPLPGLPAGYSDPAVLKAMDVLQKKL